MLLALPSLAKVIEKDSSKQLNLQFDLDDSVVKEIQKNSQTLSQVELKVPAKYQGIYYKVGAPQIPVVRIYFFGEAEVQVEESKGLGTFFLKAPLMPNDAPLQKTKGATQALNFDQSIYNSSQSYPKTQETRWTIENVGQIRGQMKKMLTIFPVIYTGKDNQLNWMKKFDVKIKKELAPIDMDKGSFAFVTANRFANSPVLNDYIQQKKALGFRIHKLVMGETLVSSADIRSALQGLLRNDNLKYAILVGDIEDVPSWDDASISGPSDHYYRALDTSDYLNDINGPDIGLGRFSARNEEELSAIVEKSRIYQEAAQSKSWKQTASFLATDDRWELAEATHNYVINSFTKARNYQGIFPEEFNLGGDLLYSISHRVPNNIVQQAIQMGRSIINYSGHGARTFWDAPRVTQSDVRALNSGQALPFVVSNACITGDFRVDESFAETWQRHPSGSIVYWGSVDNTYWDEDDILERRMFDGIFQEGNKTFASITQYALSENWRHYGGSGKSRYYWETYTVFGDPSLELISAR